MYFLRLLALQLLAKVLCIKEELWHILNIFGEKERSSTLSLLFDNISQKLNGMASKSANLFKAMLTPLKLASKEYVEKFENMRATVSKFQQHFQA